MSEREASGVQVHGSEGRELLPLERGIGKLEIARMKEILERAIGGQAARIVYDVGGVTRAYALWLAGQGHEVHLFDPGPGELSLARLDRLPASRSVALIERAASDRLPRQANTADIVLLLGPLIHLMERHERQAVIREAARVLKPGGLLVASAVSRYGSMLCGLSAREHDSGLLGEDEFMNMIERELGGEEDVLYDIPSRLPACASFYLPDELAEELERTASLLCDKLLAVEGPVWMLPTFEDKWADEESRHRLLRIVRQLEEERSIMGVSPHIVAICIKPRT